MPSHEGGCLCGAVRYRLSGAPVSSVLCHCASCRRASGAPSVAWLTVAREQFEVRSGSPTSFHSSPGVIRRFCGICGSALTYENAKSPSTIDITTLTLDHPDDFAPTDEVWMRDKVAWQPIDAARGHHLEGTAGP